MTGSSASLKHVHKGEKRSSRRGTLFLYGRILDDECLIRPFVIGNPAFIAWHHTRDRVDRLLSKVKSLREEGMNAFMLTGGYGYPPNSITGDIREDIMFFSEVLGLKLAIVLVEYSPSCFRICGFRKPWGSFSDGSVSPSSA